MQGMRFNSASIRGIITVLTGVVLFAAILTSPRLVLAETTSTMDVIAVYQKESKRVTKLINALSSIPSRKIDGRLLSSPLTTDDKLSLSKDNTVYLAIGIKVTKQLVNYLNGKKIIAAMVSESEIEHLYSNPGTNRNSVTALVVDQPVERLLLLADEVSDHNSIVLPYSTANNTSKITRIKQFALKNSIRLTLKQIDLPLTTHHLIDAIRGSEAVLAIPDRALHNRSNAKSIILNSYRMGVPLVAYSKAYSTAGASAALYSSIENIAADISALLDTNKTPATDLYIVKPTEFSVTVNRRVSDSLNLRLPDATSLKATLIERMNQ
ncbi:hypothetical protein BOW53_01465 [Solemya pervernicosa gill symbiont]|uniref:ABC transporter substrate-binding protein n=1 Tax=Solemya pervernicosa gill symbiont TaxID=642797 RepID=A0A1T2LAG1_9GAMM|nr:hypothetical protein [Solemya pervernicosa gill symbiont]OOZ42034.1 hypothetical protein BOW53_01465 [Solemya pervernicosa gill symbiont]